MISFFILPEWRRQSTSSLADHIWSEELFWKFDKLKSSDLVDIVLDQLRGMEFHVPVHGALAEHLVMVVVLVITSLSRIILKLCTTNFTAFYLQHHQVLPLFVGQFFVVAFFNRKFRNVVVDCLLPRWGTFQESDWVVRGVHIVQRRVRLASA
jgi:hypothetical protein